MQIAIPMPRKAVVPVPKPDQSQLMKLFMKSMIYDVKKMMSYKKQQGVWADVTRGHVSVEDSAFLEIAFIDSLYDKVGDIDGMKLRE